jgi:hypothetical protein
MGRALAPEDAFDAPSKQKTGCRESKGLLFSTAIVTKNQ